jgi:hypothetical protein
MRPTLALHTRLIVCVMVSVLLTAFVTTRPAVAQRKEAPLVVRVAVFSADQGTLQDHRDWIERHLFPALRSTSGHAGTFLARDPESGEVISLSFWDTNEDMLAAEQAVGREIRALPAGSAPRPSTVKRYVVEYREVQGAMK